MPHRLFAPPTKAELCDLREAMKRSSEYLTKIYKGNNMKKKLKIKIWEPERALAIQVVEQEGLPRIKTNGVVRISGCIDTNGEILYLRGEHSSYDFDVASAKFNTNQDRDEWLDKIIQSITDELFTSGQGELKVGELCEVSGCPEGHWRTRKLIAILPDTYRSRFITQSDEEANNWFGYKYARPLGKRTDPKVETYGEITTYTWEEE